MPDLDDEKFELYLKQFQPLLPEALPVTEVTRQARRRIVLGIWAVGAAAAMVIGVLSFRGLYSHVSESNHPAIVEIVPNQPLTMRNADALLAMAPSYKPVMDELAFPRQRPMIPHGQESALAVLRKEKIKL